MDESHHNLPASPSRPDSEGRVGGVSRSSDESERPGRDGQVAPTVDGPGDGAATADCGRVYLVGAGPGDPDLLTRRAWEVIERADAILYDSLTGDRLLSELPTDTAAVDVGKRPPDPVAQDEIHDRLVTRAGGGEAVVRLKGGDPNLFGRGGEEAEHLATKGVPFEVVPGVSSLLAAPSVAGIPLTHREHASSVTVVPGHETPGKDESALDWTGLAATLCTGGTLVVLMGVATLPAYVARLREEGVPVDTPLALVEKATWDDERTVTTTLGDAVADVDAAGVSPPAVTIVGDVVGVRERVEGSLCRR
jgi:uroporphyrin-III C-methyltransferase